MKKFIAKIFNKNLGKSQRYTSKFRLGLLAQQQGFTLAEVLITLGIIGVVAALTIPYLMKNYQEFQYKQAAKKAFSVASQAIVQMNQDNGGDLSYFGNTTKSFVLEFEKYFKSPRDCSPDKCVAGGNPSPIYKNLLNNNANGNRIDDGQFVAADGAFWGLKTLALVFR